jgi:hypothetical protein
LPSIVPQHRALPPWEWPPTPSPVLGSSVARSHPFWAQHATFPGMGKGQSLFHMPPNQTCCQDLTCLPTSSDESVLGWGSDLPDRPAHCAGRPEILQARGANRPGVLCGGLVKGAPLRVQGWLQQTPPYLFLAMWHGMCPPPSQRQVLMVRCSCWYWHWPVTAAEWTFTFWPHEGAL